MDRKEIKILAIDDNQDNLIIIRALVKEAFPDAVIFTALDGIAGLELAASADPDVILLDVVMPGMDGFEVCQKLKSNEELKDIPVVFVTALKGNKESRIRALEVGAEAFLAKPIDESELTAQIRAMLKIKLASIEKRNENERLAALVELQTQELKRTHAATLQLLETLKNENEARKKTEIALRQSEEKFRSIFKNMVSGCCFDQVIYENGKPVDYRILDANPSFEKILGLPLNEVIGKLASEVYKTSDIPYLSRFFRVAESGIPESFEAYFEASGKILNITTICPEKGKFSNILSDVTEQKQTEQALRRSEAIQGKMVSNIGDVIVILDKEGTLRYNSPNIEKWFGWKPKDLIGASSWEHLFPEDVAFSMKFLEDLLSAPNKTGTIQCRFKCKDASYKWIEITMVNLIHDEDINGLLGNFHDITNRKQEETELKIAKERAEESDRLKTAFLANMSHEIRTPMNGILGFAELLKEPELNGEKQKKYIDIIEKSGVRMLNIINDIIDISKIESREMNLSISEMNVGDQMNYIYSFFKPEAERKQLQFTLRNNFSSNPVFINTDKEKVYAILVNLIKNALKFTQHGGIEIGYERDEGSLEFFVKDTGMGISEENVPYIFERFRQGSDSLSRNFEGAGLGLAIAKAYVEMLGGKIRLKSKLGEGTVFYVTIPFDLEPGTRSVVNSSCYFQ